MGQIEAGVADGGPIGASEGPGTGSRQWAAPLEALLLPVLTELGKGEGPTTTAEPDLVGVGSSDGCPVAMLVPEDRWQLVDLNSRL